MELQKSPTYNVPKALTIATYGATAAVISAESS